MVRDRSSEAYWKPSISVSICTRTNSRVSGPSVKSVHHRFRCVFRHRASSDSLLKKLIVMEDRVVVDAARNKNKNKRNCQEDSSKDKLKSIRISATINGTAERIGTTVGITKCRPSR